ncbi:DNA repair protein RecO [Halomonas denitrificans]|nr:DNA repair protein RecO [Halomonas denitrificans]
MNRVDREPAFVLHRRPYRETSLTVELLTATHGRVAGVARGARGARSALRPLGQPFVPLEVSWVRRGEMATLTGAEPVGRTGVPTGRALWCALYANELLLKLLPRDVEESEVFIAYAHLLPALADASRQASALRRFELVLLNALGVAPELDVVGEARIAVEPDGWYRVDPVRGPEPVGGPAAGGRERAGREQVVSGDLLRALAAGRELSAEQAAAARRLMRELIEHQLDGRRLETPRLYRE